MNEFIVKVLDRMKQEQKQDETDLKRSENSVKDLETKLRERGYCIAVLEKSCGK